MKNMNVFRAALGVLALLSGLARPDMAHAKAKPDKDRIGGVTAALAGPEGLTRVDGLNARVDKYVAQAALKLNLKPLALYAEPAEWKSFTAAAGAGRPAPAPRFALLCTTTAMPEKSYDPEALRREFGKYEKWFSAAANNRPLAAILTAQGNRKLAEALGADIGFVFKADRLTGKFDRGSDSLALGARVDFNIFGEPSQVFLTATALAVGDKIVFLGYLEKDGDPAAVKAVQERAIAWRRLLGSLNAGQYQAKR